MKTRSNRHREKETAEYDEFIRKTDLGRFTAIFIIVGATIACVVTLLTQRPEVFWICTITAIVSSTALLTGNSGLNSISISALPVYIFLVPYTFLVTDYRGPAAAVTSVSIHLVNLVLVLFVLFLSGKRVQPIVIIISSVFYATYIAAFIVAVGPEFGTLDPYHWFYNVFFAAGIVTFDTVMAVVIKYRRKVPYFS